jgi:hypothetical protein
MHPESKPAKWLFPQEKTTLKDPGKGTLTLVPLKGCRSRRKQRCVATKILILW